MWLEVSVVVLVHASSALLLCLEAKLSRRSLGLLGPVALSACVMLPLLTWLHLMRRNQHVRVLRLSSHHIPLLLLVVALLGTSIEEYIGARLRDSLLFHGRLVVVGISLLDFLDLLLLF